jgi:hypothetical protein
MESAKRLQSDPDAERFECESRQIERQHRRTQAQPPNDEDGKETWNDDA